MPLRHNEDDDDDLTSDLKWAFHIEHICSKASKRLCALRTLKRSGVRRAISA